LTITDPSPQSVTQKKETGFTVSPYLLGFIFFVLVGSSVFELLKNVGGKK
jgi:hypothetical protein